MNDVLIVIPARYGSSRLPGKMLKTIAGKPVIQHVYEACKKANVGEVFIATESQIVVDAVAKFGATAILTSENCQSGTDRIFEVAKNRTEPFIINVQGDEPMIPPEIIDRLAGAFAEEPDLKMATMVTRMEESEYGDPSAVKVVTDKNGYALFFSRSLIPYPRNRTELFKVYKHVGIYAYTRTFLMQYAAMAPTPLEQVESLEQLRVLENGYKIKVLESDFRGIGVDTQEDLDAVNKLFAEKEA